MDENKINENKKDKEELIDDLFGPKSDVPDEAKPGQLWELGDGSQSKLFKNTALGSLIAGVVVGGILVFFFGKYM